MRQPAPMTALNTRLRPGVPPNPVAARMMHRMPPTTYPIVTARNAPGLIVPNARVCMAVALHEGYAGRGADVRPESRRRPQPRPVTDRRPPPTDRRHPAIT